MNLKVKRSPVDRINAKCLWIEDLKEHCELNEKSSILDLGCGQGYLARALSLKFGSQLKYLGLDPVAKNIEKAKRYSIRQYDFEQINVYNSTYNVSGEKRYAELWPLVKHKIDLAVMFSVVTHIPYEETLHYVKELTNVISKGNIFITAYFFGKYDPNEKSKFTFPYVVNENQRIQFEDRPAEVVAVNELSLKKELEECGWKNIKIVYGEWRRDRKARHSQDFIVANKG